MFHCTWLDDDEHQAQNWGAKTANCIGMDIGNMLPQDAASGAQRVLQDIRIWDDERTAREQLREEWTPNEIKLAKKFVKRCQHSYFVL